MADAIISDGAYEEQKPVCDDKDWKCMLDNIYVGYLLLLEAHVKVGEETIGDETIPIIKVNSVDVSDLSTDDINAAIGYFKEIYPDAVAYRLHFCGNHMGKPCKFFDV